MKKNKRKARILFYISAFGFLISSATVFLSAAIPNAEGEISFLSNLTGALFWLGALLGCSCFIMSWNAVKEDKKYVKVKKDTKPGAVSFASTGYGKLADCLVAVFLILLIAGIFMKFSDIVMMFCFFVLLYSFYLHFLLNGRVYRYLFTREKEGETI